MRPSFVLVALFFLVTACQSESPSDAGVTELDGQASDSGGADAGTYNGDFERDPSRVTLHGACPVDQRIGGFSVQMNETLGYTAIDGVVKNGVVPNTIRDVVMEEGGCQLLRRRHLVCDPPCSSGATCGLDETCIPAPVGQDLGAVTIFGLVQPVELTAQQPGNTYFYTRLPHPGVEAGAVVQLTAPTPRYFRPFELYGVGVRQLVPAEDRWILTEGQPLTLRWDAPPEGARSRVFVELDIDLHGLTPLLLTCDLPDTSTATISEGLVGALITAGVTGFPEGRVTRRTMDSAAQGSECVDFAVTSVRTVKIEVTGHIPCARQSDCPSPLVCDLAIQQCH